MNTPFALWKMQSLASQVRKQLNSARTKGKPVEGFNYSTTTLLKRYLEVWLSIWAQSHAHRVVPAIITSNKLISFLLISSSYLFKDLIQNKQWYVGTTGTIVQSFLGLLDSLLPLAQAWWLEHFRSPWWTNRKDLDSPISQCSFGKSAKQCIHFLKLDVSNVG